MVVAWTEHRFAGGALALDAANTVVLRNDPVRTFDRFAEAREIGRFAVAASHFRIDELGGRAVVADGGDMQRDAVLAVRDTTDALFRAGALGLATDGPMLAAFLAACARGVDRVPDSFFASDRPFGDGGPLALEAAMAVSALSLLAPDKRRRLKICANCDWLFLDRSRNSSRLWCDMKVCGNRSKARRHYHRHKPGTGGHDHA
ncbi:MAG: CGNR zinc finger domain-containing protein [Rhizobiaceae bacterium]|nr:CGNR zinc finger domain-containing protein [Rhizobiaceae bacterium]